MPWYRGRTVDLLQVEQIGALPLDGEVAARLAVSLGDEVMVPLGQLPAQARFGVHPLHHVVQLPGGEQLPVGGGESLAGQPADQVDITLGSVADRQHWETDSRVFDKITGAGSGGGSDRPMLRRSGSLGGGRQFGRGPVAAASMKKGRHQPAFVSFAREN